VQAAIPLEIKLWGYARGEHELERELHKKYAAQRHRRELFHLSQADREELAVLARKTKGFVKKVKVRVCAEVIAE
jgi:hypothetical protein